MNGLNLIAVMQGLQNAVTSEADFKIMLDATDKLIKAHLDDYPKLYGEEIKFVSEGNRIEAIKAYRLRNRLNLKVAKWKVDDYIAKKCFGT